jgi:hypothetical protein
MKTTKKIWTAAAIMLAATACAKKKSDNTETQLTETAPATTPSVSNPSPASTNNGSTTPTKATVWIASNALRTIAGYDTSGNRLAFIDLSTSLSSGYITAMTFISKDVMLAFADPGASGERIFRIDLSTNTVTNLNTSWFMDTTNLSAMAAYSIVKWSSTKLFIPKQTGASTIEQLTFNFTSNIVSRTGNPWVPNTLGSCLSTSNQYALPVTSATGTKKLLTLSSSTNSRINIYGNIDSAVTCDGSYNFATTAPASAAYVPTGAVQGSDGKIYVRYQHATTPAIFRYDVDASMTTLTAGTNIYSDTGYLNPDVTSRDMVTVDGDFVLLANWGVDAIVKLNLLTGLTEYFAKDIFTTDVNAIAIRPAQ